LRAYAQQKYPSAPILASWPAACMLAVMFVSFLITILFCHAVVRHEGRPMPRDLMPARG
jgi:hypothetical protein